MSQATRRTLRILEYLAGAGEVSLSQIATDLGLTVSTTHRFLATLVDEGYLRQNPRTRHYSLTLRVLNVAAQTLASLDIRSVLRPVLESLSASTEETSHLALLDRMEVTYIDKVDGSGAVQMASHVGYRAPCHSTALGKVLLAALAEPEWKRYIDEHGLEPRTDHTITDPAEFLAELGRVRRRGYALDNLENENGIRCVAAPIRDHTATVTAALSISGWTLSMTMTRIRNVLVPVVLEHASGASQRLGGS